jgi:methionyl-tRNA formyltransferase
VITTVFLGTPTAGIPSLRVLASKTNLRLVVTRPDRPRGRSGRARPSPIKEAAMDLGLAVTQPSDAEELGTTLSQTGDFDVGVVVAFGMILDPTTLRLPDRGFVNLHFSLLPRWRGAAPVERAILAGDETTGVTLMMMDEGLDTGPIVASESTPIGSEETAGDLTVRLAELGAGLLSQHLVGYVEQRRQPVPQPREGVTHAGRITTDEAAVSAEWKSEVLLRAVRAYAPRPGARFEEANLKVWRATPTDRPSITPGRLEFDGRRLYLGTGDRPIELVEVQSPGGKRLTGAAWARGRGTFITRIRG